MKPTVDIVGREAFNALLTTRGPLSVERLAELLRVSRAAVDPLVNEMEEAGNLIRDGDGDAPIVGVLGLSVVPTQHELDVDGISRWTWCAWDALGLALLLGDAGVVRSTSPDSGMCIVVRFSNGSVTHDPAEAVLVFAKQQQNCITVRDWCPLVNLFESEQAAQSWMERNGVTGEIQQVHAASIACAKQYRPLLSRGKRSGFGWAVRALHASSYVTGAAWSGLSWWRRFAGVSRRPDQRGQPPAK